MARKKPVCTITSDDDSVTIVESDDGRCCKKVDLSVHGSKLASMVYEVARAAAAATGNEDVPCVNEDPSNAVAFKPTWAELLLTHDGNAPQVGSKGSAKLTDGTAVVRQGMGYFFDVGGVDFSGCADMVVGYVFSNPAAATSWFVTLVAAPATTTLRLAWVKGGAGLDIHGVLKITGIIP